MEQQQDFVHHAAAEAAAAPPQLVDEHGNPVESAQHKREVAAQAIGQLVKEWQQRQLSMLATGVLADATKELVGARTCIGQVKPGADRMGFWLAFQIRIRFLKTARQAPAAVYDYKVAMPKRRRREIIRQFAERDERTLHAAADAIIADTEFAAAILSTWNQAFEGDSDGARESDADPRATDSRAAAAPEATGASDISLRDAPRERSTPEIVTSASL